MLLGAKTPVLAQVSRAGSLARSAERRGSGGAAAEARATAAAAAAPLRCSGCAARLFCLSRYAAPPEPACSEQCPEHGAPAPPLPPPPTHPSAPTNKPPRRPPGLYTKPSIAKIQVCSRSVAVSQNGAGTVMTSSSSSFKLPKIASTACAEAVTNGVKDVCTGGDPVATIASMASTCASAIAELQASSISGAEVKAGSVYPPANFTKTAYATACASGCANGQAAAEAVAQATACAISQQTHGCNAVKTVINGQGYSSAFVSTTAKAWSNACALGYGKAQSEGEALAKTLVQVLSRAFADVVSSACSDCDACKCKPLSELGVSGYDKLKGASDTSAAAADGRFTMARAFSRAAASYCSSDKTPKALKTSVDTTISTLATMMADVYAKTSGGSSASGSALACSGGSVSTQLQVGGAGVGQGGVGQGGRGTARGGGVARGVASGGACAGREDRPPRGL